MATKIIKCTWKMCRIELVRPIDRSCLSLAVNLTLQSTEVAIGASWRPAVAILLPAGLLMRYRLSGLAGSIVSAARATACPEYEQSCSSRGIVPAASAPQG